VNCDYLILLWFGSCILRLLHIQALYAMVPHAFKYRHTFEIIEWVCNWVCVDVCDICVHLVLPWHYMFI